MPPVMHESQPLHDAEEPASASFGYADPFTPARSRKKRKNRPGREPPAPSVLLAQTREELAASGWLRESIQCLRDALGPPPARVPARALCLGLGSPAGSRDARAQLAFLLAACEDLGMDRAQVAVFDPAFTAEDAALLDALALCRLAENRHARHRADGPTLVFMPHCDLRLYENLLRANWARARLPALVLVANRLGDYADNTPAHKLARESPCVARLAPHLAARPLPACAPYPTAFASTAVQTVHVERLAAMQAEWWELPAEAEAEAGAAPESEPRPQRRSGDAGDA